jgi:uncharacterized heparinase superfamily protein
MTGAAVGLGERLRGLAFANPLYELTLGHSRPRELALVLGDPWPGCAARGQQIMAGRFPLAGTTLSARPPSWLCERADPRSLDILNGFAWLRDLRAAGGDGARRQARRLVADWLEHHDRWHPHLWRPDVLARRIANWIAAHGFFCASADDEFRAAVFASLARQVRHLARTAPGAVEGPEAVAVIKGLVYGAAALSEGERQLGLAARLLKRELDVQVPADGVHPSRSPLRQLDLLRDLVDIRMALHAAKVAGLGQAADMAEAAEVGEALLPAIERMAHGLRALRHGDDGLALFHGGAEGEPLMIDTALTQAGVRSRPLKTARHGGYERIVAGRTLAIIDAGGPPPAGFDADAHAAPLGFELSVGRDRLIVNCGAWPRPGDGSGWAYALRSTAAHSTLCVADTNAIEIAEDGLGEVFGPVTAERVQVDEGILVAARHAFYRRTFGVTHKRRLFVARGGEDVRGEDLLARHPDRGSGTLPFAVRFHLHPDVSVAAVQSGDSALLRLPGGAGWRLRVAGARLCLEDSVYLGDGAAPRPSRQVVLHGEAGPDETRLRWAIARERRS